jgi:CRP-like cAMP-binding protein
MADGRTIELAKLGRETLIAPAAFSESSGAALAEIAVLVPDTAALVTGSDAFQECLDRSPKLRELVDSHSRQIMRAVAQTGACNGVHSVEERLCLGLLVACDRMRMEEIRSPRTRLHALAVRRPTVSLVMNSLQRAGLIECGRGRIRLISRKGLEAISCECYGVLRNGAEPQFGVHQLSA